MATLQHFEKIIKKYVSRTPSPDEYLWKLEASPISGRGLFATKDIPAGTDILTDYPLLCGPRSSTNTKPICVCCHKFHVKLHVCSRGCGLPICSDVCGESASHRKDCDLIMKLMEVNRVEPFTEWSLDMLRALTCLRSLHLSEEHLDVLFNLQGNALPEHGFEIDLLQKCNIIPTDDQKRIMFQACYALDTNAFEIVAKTDIMLSLRGLYPLGGLMNHSCTPNTMHVSGKDKRVIFRSAMDIEKGEELTSSYTNLLWGTPTRRHHLYKTKHFWCYCERCTNDTEFGVGLSALKCKNEACSGILLPEYPLESRCSWKCNRCPIRLSAKFIGVIQCALGSLTNSFVLDSPVQVVEYTRTHLPKVIPVCNQIVVEFKYRIVWMLGHRDGYLWNELTDDYLAYKEQACRDTLDVVNRLRLGQCKLRGLVLHELYVTLGEKLRRMQAKCTRNEDATQKEIKDEMLKMNEESSRILRDHVLGVSI